VEQQQDQQKMGGEPMQAAQVASHPDRRFQKQDGIEGLAGCGLVVEKQEQAGACEHQQGAEGKPTEAEGVGDGEILLQHHPRKQVFDELLEQADLLE